VGPVVGAGVLLLLQRPQAAAVVAVLGLGLFVAAWAVPAVELAVHRALAAVASAVGRGLTVVLLVPVALLLVTPVAYVLRLLRWDPLERIGGVGWVRRRPRREPARRAFADERLSRPSSGPVRGIATGVVTAAVLASLLVVGALVVSQVTGLGDERAQQLLSSLPLVDDDRAPASPAAPAPATVAPEGAQEGGRGGPDPDDEQGAIASYNLLAHQDAPWAESMFAETFRVPTYFDPLLLFRNGDLDGEHVNVVDGVRQSHRPTGVEDPIEVWFLGASSLYGIGQRDEHTIPSEVARLAEQDGIVLDVRNLGVSAYTNWQSLLRLQLELADGGRPDVVVTYDGVNEVPAYLWGGRGAEPGTLFADDVQQRLLDTAEAGVLLAPPPLDPEPSVAEAVEAYLDPLRIVDGLGAGYGFEVAHFFQPSLYTIELTAAEEDVIDFVQTDEGYLTMAREVTDEVREQLDGEVVDLGGVLDEVERPVLYDWAHTNEAGALAVAEAVYAELGPELEAIVDTR
jgi:hypothetical protein